MNKSEIITVVSSKLKNKLSKVDVESVVNTFIETLQETLLNNEKISFKGFLTLDTRFVKEKSGHSFGTDWSIGSRYVARAKFSPSFKKMMVRDLEL